MPATLANFPHELLAAILRATLDDSPEPSAILRVCTLWHDLGTAHLYTHLRFTSAPQLRLFALAGTEPWSGTRPPIVPRSLVVDLAGTPQREVLVLRYLGDALLKCGRLAHAAEECKDRAYGGPNSDLRLRCLRLRMHSYSRDCAVDVFEGGLRAVSPDTFEWIGPDPDHHFSTAIVPPVASCLFKNFSSWHNVREITVTNISFVTDYDPEGLNPPLMGDVPSLRTLYIGQATFLHAQAIAGMFSEGRMARLNVCRLVDAYSESIWGPRLRRSDIERAARTLYRTGDQMAAIARIRAVVTCEKKTERIMGGDRVEGTPILD